MLLDRALYNELLLVTIFMLANIFTLIYCCTCTMNVRFVSNEYIYREMCRSIIKKYVGEMFYCSGSYRYCLVFLKIITKREKKLHLNLLVISYM